MGKKCPNCGFKYKDDLDSCPKCGFDLKNQSIDEINEEKNDDIKWSEYGDVPLESVMEMFTETPDSTAKASETEEVTEAQDVTEEKVETIQAEEESAASEEQEMADASDLDETVEPVQSETSAESVVSDELVENPDKLSEDQENEQSAEEPTVEEAETVKVNETTEVSEAADSSEAHTDEETEKNSSAEESNMSEEDQEDSENDLLAAYIREHRGEEVSSSSVAVAASKSEEKTQAEEAETVAANESLSKQVDQMNPELPEDHANQTNPEESEQKVKPDSPVVAEDASEKTSDSVSVGEKVEDKSVDELNTKAVDSATLVDAEQNEEETETDAAPQTPIFGEAPKAPDTNKVILDKVELLDAEPSEDVQSKEATGSSDSAAKSTSHKKRNIARGITAAAVLILGASAWTVYSQNKKADEAQQVEETKKKATELEAIQGNLAEFYTDDTHEFIRTEKVSADLTKLSSQLSALKDQKGYQKVADEFKDVSDKVGMIQKVNALFTTAVVSDNTLVKEPILKEDKQIELEASTETTDFAKLMNEAIATAQTQFDELQTAKELVDVIYVDGKVTEKANKENYDAAKSAVDKVKNKELVKELTTGLQAVKKQIDTEANKAKEAAQKAEAAKQAEAAAQAEAANNAAATENNTTSQASSGNSSSVSNVEWTYDSQGMRHPVFQKNNQGLPILASRQSDIDDANNAAWGWASGVKENVLSIAFSRGYIVEGGYYLEPVRIEDGEGFYNLYATKPSNLLSSDYSFPVYLMTINCKTGWFGGNGSDQTQ